MGVAGMKDAGQGREFHAGNAPRRRRLAIDCAVPRLVLPLKHGSTSRVCCSAASGVQDAGDRQEPLLHGDKRRAFVQAARRVNSSRSQGGAAGMLARGHAVRLTGARVKRCNGGRCAGILRLRVREGPAQPV